MLTVGICTIIVVVLGYYVKQSSKLSNYYLKLKEDVSNNKSNQNPTFENENIQNMYNEFGDSLTQTANVNTQVIIEKYMYENSKTANLENALEYLIPFATVLGLLGTFIGLTGAIDQTSVVLQDVSKMETFVKELRPALDSMAGAFITSIFGIIASAVMNIVSFLNKFAYKVHKQEFIDEIESYLDNVVAGNRSEAQVDKLLVSMTQAVNTMTKEVTSSISSSMGQLTVSMNNSMNILVSEITKLNEKITNVSIDMTSSAEALEITIDKFSRPVKTFKNSMDKFVDAYEGMDNKVEKMDDIVDNFIRYFNQNMESHRKGQEVIEKVAKELNNNINLLETTYEKLNDIIKATDNTLKENTKNSHQSSIDIKQELENINETMKNFNVSVDEMSDKVARATKESIENSTEDITNKVADILKTTTNGLNENVILNKEILEVMTDTIQAIHDQVKDFEAVALSR